MSADAKQADIRSHEIPCRPVFWQAMSYWVISTFVGLPDKSHVRPLDRLPMPPKIQAIPTNTKVLGAY